MPQFLIFIVSHNYIIINKKQNKKGKKQIMANTCKQILQAFIMQIKYIT
jgi:hypothetical protein